MWSLFNADTLGTAENILISCPRFRGSIVHFSIMLAGTIDSVLIEGGVLISGVGLYISLSSWDPRLCPD